MRQTRSICPVCYEEIPAIIRQEGDLMVMRKYCERHKQFDAVVEKDVAFYNYCMDHNSRGIYAGHLVDVTDRCNLKCRYCYHQKKDSDIPVEMILKNCLSAPGPYILTGGEPTLRKDIHAVIEAVKAIGPVVLLTNGYGLQDPLELAEYAAQLTGDDGVTKIGLSFHPEAPWFEDVMVNITNSGLKLETIFFVIDSLDQLPKIKGFAEMTKDNFVSFRIKIASPIWSENKASGLFTSDVINWFIGQDDVTEYPMSGKITYYTLKHNGIFYPIINWYNVHNVDLNDIDCPPTYTTRDGRVMDFVKAMIHNEALIDKTCGISGHT
jgi:hypothetical protein